MARTCRHLDLDGRRTPSRTVEARRPVGEIAARPGRHRSTIHREPGRSRCRDGDRGFRGYFPLTARDLARRRRQRRRTLAADPAPREQVVERPEAGWSPRRIAGGLEREEADGGAAACRETIHRHVHGPEGRADGLCRHLPKARRRRGSRYGRRPRERLHPARALDREPAGGGRDARERSGAGRPAC